MRLGFSYLKQFGEAHPDYPIRVINEGEARAGAGLLFAFAMGHEEKYRRHRCGQ